VATIAAEVTAHPSSPSVSVDGQSHSLFLTDCAHISPLYISVTFARPLPNHRSARCWTAKWAADATRDGSTPPPLTFKHQRPRDPYLDFDDFGALKCKFGSDIRFCQPTRFRSSQSYSSKRKNEMVMLGPDYRNRQNSRLPLLSGLLFGRLGKPPCLTTSVNKEEVGQKPFEAHRGSYVPEAFRSSSNN
jgi:hypothetical protein